MLVNVTRTDVGGNSASRPKAIARTVSSTPPGDVAPSPTILPIVGAWNADPLPRYWNEATRPVDNRIRDVLTTTADERLGCHERSRFPRRGRGTGR